MTRALDQRSQWWPNQLPLRRPQRLPRSFLQPSRRLLCLALLRWWPVVGMQRQPVAPRAQRSVDASLVEGAYRGTTLITLLLFCRRILSWSSVAVVRSIDRVELQSVHDIVDWSIWTQACAWTRRKFACSKVFSVEIRVGTECVLCLWLRACLPRFTDLLLCFREHSVACCHPEKGG